MSTTRQVTDMMGREVTVPSVPKRIISLVPSQTELIADLGLGDSLVGITKFCIHPDAVFRSVKRVGGTKKIDYEAIDALSPDLVIANKEENTKEIVETLALKYPVWVSDIKTIAESLEMIELLGELLSKTVEAKQLTNEIREAWASFETGISKRGKSKVAYLIWQNPIMLAGHDTFIHDNLQNLGFENVSSSFDSRYPEVTSEQLQDLNPDLLFLSSEPFPFKEKHILEWKKALPSTQVHLVDGEMFSWYGSRMRLAVPYFKELLEKLS